MDCWRVASINPNKVIEKAPPCLGGAMNPLFKLLPHYHTAAIAVHQAIVAAYQVDRGSSCLGMYKYHTVIVVLVKCSVLIVCILRVPVDNVELVHLDAFKHFLQYLKLKPKLIEDNGLPALLQNHRYSVFDGIQLGIDRKYSA